MLGLLITGLALTGASHAAPSAERVASAPLPVEAEVLFSPDGGITQRVVAEVGAAKKSLVVMAYSFTSAPIAEAVVTAHRRGVVVEVLLDRTQRGSRYSSADFLTRAGVAVWIDRKHPIMHNKVMVIDGATVITGSFNFTKAAEEKNAENLLVLRSPELAARYLAEFEKLKGMAEAAEGVDGAARLYQSTETPLPQ